MLHRVHIIGLEAIVDGIIDWHVRSTQWIFQRNEQQDLHSSVSDVLSSGHHIMKSSPSTQGLVARR